MSGLYLDRNFWNGDSSSEGFSDFSSGEFVVEMRSVLDRASPDGFFVGAYCCLWEARKSKFEFRVVPMESPSCRYRFLAGINGPKASWYVLPEGRKCLRDCLWTRRISPEGNLML